MSDDEHGPEHDAPEQDGPEQGGPEQDGAGQDGQVSEVQSMDAGDADTPISDSQAVAGQPNDESGEVQEGPTGPNARTGATSEREDHDR